ncbi:unnamed protein product [Caenorhabditis brenneri]
MMQSNFSVTPFQQRFEEDKQKYMKENEHKLSSWSKPEQPIVYRACQKNEDESRKSRDERWRVEKQEHRVMNPSQIGIKRKFSAAAICSPASIPETLQTLKAIFKPKNVKITSLKDSLRRE